MDSEVNGHWAGGYRPEADARNTSVGIDVVLGKCNPGTNLESVIRSLDSEAKVDRFGNGTVVYSFNNFSSAKGLGPDHGAFKATVIDYREAIIGCNGSNVGITVTSNSLTLLNAVIAEIIRAAGVQVITHYPNVLNLNSGSGNGAPASPSAHYSSPGVSLN